MSTHNENKNSISVSTQLIKLILIVWLVVGLGSIPSVIHAQNQYEQAKE